MQQRLREETGFFMIRSHNMVFNTCSTVSNKRVCVYNTRSGAVIPVPPAWLLAWSKWTGRDRCRPAAVAAAAQPPCPVFLQGICKYTTCSEHLGTCSYCLNSEVRLSGAMPLPVSLISNMSHGPSLPGPSPGPPATTDCHALACTGCTGALSGGPPGRSLGGEEGAEANRACRLSTYAGSC